MDLNFKVMIHRQPAASTRCSRRSPIPKELSSYFTTGGASGRLETGATVTWDFADFPGAFPVEVDEVVAEREDRLRLGSAEGEPATADISD